MLRRKLEYEVGLNETFSQTHAARSRSFNNIPWGRLLCLLILLLIYAYILHTVEVFHIGSLSITNTSTGPDADTTSSRAGGKSSSGTSSGSKSSSSSGSSLPAFCPASCIREAVESRLAAEFPAQTELLWPTIASCLIRQFGSPPPVEAPSVVLLFNGAGDMSSATKRTLDLLINRLSRLLASGIGECKCRSMTTPDAAGCSEVDAKTAATTEAIDAAATEAVTSKRSCLAIRRIDQLTGPASLIFYRLADSTEAPHRPFLYILTVEGDDGGEEVVDETSLQRQLRQTWVSSGLQNEQFDPLWARIGGNVVAVLPESENNLRQLSR
ncbi:hypothetical protein BOX15_Mlig030279g3 [Macrostomum lignano]|uniref:Uncharacterized protein n=1 Tax=Macrostomum lignano TaxID=282301 RepID=A0A267DLS2_9PLAT|nr:hypothetical protein BOX15_Mlig030279g3 [Macrostomum lignano]